MTSSTINRALSVVRIDPAGRHPRPSWASVAMATVAAVLASLLADALLVAVGTAVFPSTKGYVHFRFADYARLTVVGVILAGLVWPLVAQRSHAPRWVFSRLAVAVTAVLLLPDVAILAKGEPVRAVVVLVAMHLAIGVITYQLLVRAAPVPAGRGPRERR